RVAGADALPAAEVSVASRRRPRDVRTGGAGRARRIACLVAKDIARRLRRVVGAGATAGDLVVALERILRLAERAADVGQRRLALEQFGVVELSVAVHVAARLLHRAVAVRRDAVDDVAQVVGGGTSGRAGGAADLLAEFGGTAALIVRVAVGAEHARGATPV